MLTTEQRTELETRARSRRGRADAARRARVVLLLADGESYASITAKTGCSSRTIALWKRRFVADGLAGLAARHQGSKPTVLTPTLQARILAWTRRMPPHGATHWSTRSLGRQLGVQHTIIARAWGAAGLQPHRLERYMRSTDPDFETKAADVIGLYLDPPQHAVVFCIDEKTAIQALDRIDPLLPLSPAVPNATGSSTTGTARCRCTRRSTRRPARCSAPLCRGTRATNSWPSCSRSSTRSRAGA